MANDDDWEEVWDARAEALAAVLGSGHDEVYHAPHPFSLGGQADVMAFTHHLNGVVYVTAELTGKPDACYADYELMVCHRTPQEWGRDVISRLAPYTQEAYIGAGESMDIDELFRRKLETRMRFAAGWGGAALHDTVASDPNFQRRYSAMQLGLFSISYGGLWGQAAPLRAAQGLTAPRGRRTQT